MTTTIVETTPSERATESFGPFRVDRRDDGVAVIWFDLPDSKVNVLRPELESPMKELLSSLAADHEVKAAVFASAKEDSFVVGADVEMLAKIDSEEDARELARDAQRMMSELEDFAKPLVAAIHGDCVGGGLEMALACEGRVASSADATRLGQPEVQLGVLPGAGGTQRLPRQVGLEEALQLILTGRRISTQKARRIGLVDEVVHPAILIDVAAERALALARGDESPRGRATDLKALLLEQNPVGRRVLFSQSEKKAREKTGGHMPAPFEALEAIRVGVEEGMEAGLRAEAEGFGRLVPSPEARSLIALFLARRALDRENGVDGEAEPREVNKIAVLGAGLMGAGIAQISAHEAGLPVRLKDVELEPLRDGLRSIREGLDHHVSRGKLDAPARDRIMARVRPTTDYTGFRHVDLVIEAVVENLEIKHAVVKEVEKHAPDAIFASNTSSLPIDRIAEASEHPERVIGMHYFSPAPRVPLLEVVRGRRTAPEVVATCVELGKRQGKTVIVVEDETGFYTSRILGPYLNEAARLLQEGVPIETIDQALDDYGFPVGPLELLDEVGIDVGEKIGRILHDAFGERMAPPPMQQKLVDDDRQGRKNGRGLYRYRRRGQDWERSGVDESVYELIGVEPVDDPPDGETIALRCTLAMVNEALRCYGEGIVHSARDLDVGAVFGLGFPPHLGGPARFVDQRGAKRTLEEIERLRDEHGERFEPAPLLRRLVETGARLHGEDAPEPGSLREEESR